GIRASAARSLCDVVKDWAGSCAITIKRRRDQRGFAMKWNMPIRAIESGPLTSREINELDVFLQAEDGLENPMDFSTFDGFICAVLSAPHTIMPSEWLRWVWDQEQGERLPGFSSEKQAKRILSLLIGHANALAFTLIHDRSTMSRFSIRARSKETACRSSTSGAAATSRASRLSPRVGNRSLMSGLIGLR